MVDLRAFALTAVTVVALSSAASAADLLPPPPVVEPPPPMVDMGGWYLRGDVGVGLNNIQNFSSDASIYRGYSNQFFNSNLSESGIFDAGVGYQVNNWFRGDITGELRGGSEFSGMQVSNGSSVAAIKNAQGVAQYADSYRGNLSSAIVMANAYFNLGTWYGLSPYVGGGLGVAFNRFSGGSDTGSNNYYNGGFGGSSSSGGYIGSGTQANLAWALMAGVDMSITRQLTLELGYRYLNYGSFKSGRSQCLSGNIPVGGGSFSCGGNSYQLTSSNLASNDFRIGLRYYLDAPSAPPVYDAPLVRKY